MNTQTLKINASVCALNCVLGISIITNSQDAHAESAGEACNRPILKMWKEQQSERLWSPDEETLKAEQSGKLFTYNCFTFEDISRFYDTRGGRIENAHFHPILKTKDKGDTGAASNSDDDC